MEMKIGYCCTLSALLACLLPLVFTGCGKEDVQRSDEQVSISFSMPVGQVAGGPLTKLSEEIVQNDLSKTTFRGIQELYVIPFSIDKEAQGMGSSAGWREVVVASDEFNDIRSMPAYSSLSDYKDDNDKTIKGYIYDKILLNSGINAVLVYGHATEKSTDAMASGSVAFKQHYGSLIPTKLMGEDVNTAGAIEFDLEPYLASKQRQEAFSNWKSANIALLNEVADASVTVDDKTYFFKTPSSYNNAPLEAALNRFTSEGVVFPGSNEMMGQKLTSLYKSCKALSSSGDTEVVRKLAETLCAIIESKTDLLEIVDGKVTRKVAKDEVFGLPDGVVTVRWGIKLSDGSPGFDSPGKPEGVNVTAVDDFCYPPALWYYANSPLYSTSDDKAKEQFVAGKKWSEILTKEKGWIRGINNVSRMSAVRDPMQYGVALLKLTFKKSDVANLQDKDGNPVAINNSLFPLTGIIIGGQRTQVFDFTVKEDPDNDMRFIFDADVNDKDGNAQAWISSTADSNPVFTLALSTRNAEDVNFALEFRNDSEVAFTGSRDCTILPGSKFYLIGTMKYSEGKSSAAEKPAGVFVKDHYTTLTVSFDALASSYAILPDLSSPDLQLGVNTKLTWDALTPTAVPIK